MKKWYICVLFLMIINILKSQNQDCSGYYSDSLYLRYTASGYQDVVNGNHSKAKNESYKMANLIAESELSKMVTAAVSQVIEKMMLENHDSFCSIYADTSLVSTYKVFKDMKTICRSETKLIGNTYVTHVTKEISLENIINLYDFKNNTDKQRFRTLLGKE